MGEGVGDLLVLAREPTTCPVPSLQEIVIVDYQPIYDDFNALDDCVVEESLYHVFMTTNAMFWYFYSVGVILIISLVLVFCAFLYPMHIIIVTHACAALALWGLFIASCVLLSGWAFIWLFFAFIHMIYALLIRTRLPELNVLVVAAMQIIKKHSVSCCSHPVENRNSRLHSLGGKPPSAGEGPPQASHCGNQPEGVDCCCTRVICFWGQGKPSKTNCLHPAPHLLHAGHSRRHFHLGICSGRAVLPVGICVGPHQRAAHGSCGPAVVPLLFLAVPSVEIRRPHRCSRQRGIVVLWEEVQAPDCVFVPPSLDYQPGICCLWRHIYVPLQGDFRRAIATCRPLSATLVRHSALLLRGLQQQPAACR